MKIKPKKSKLVKTGKNSYRDYGFVIEASQEKRKKQNAKATRTGKSSGQGVP